MRKEWKIFLTTVMFLTRIPVPRSIDHSPDYLRKSPKYFPLIGWVIGAISGFVFLVFGKFISSDIGILASIIAGILATGAFHEDGFADACDAFGGGWTREKILKIMKDSRIGSFGAIGLIAILMSKFFLLRELPQFTPDLESAATNVFYNHRNFLLLLITAHSISRLMPVFIIQFSDYVTEDDVSKSKPLANQKLKTPELITAFVLGLIPFIFLPWQFLTGIIPVLYITYELNSYFKKWIGGYTGDCLGAVQQVSEIIFYLSAIIIWRFAI